MGKEEIARIDEICCALDFPGEIETEKVPRKCLKCGGDMKETGTVIMID